jgi:hypothetical protein
MGTPTWWTNQMPELVHRRELMQSERGWATGRCFKPELHPVSSLLGLASAAGWTDLETKWLLVARCSLLSSCAVFAALFLGMPAPVHIISAALPAKLHLW